tara:strand:+ start:3507 stop:4310 length:804 start_codon:yes stop_codon:yes gene_type:complete
MITKEKFEFYNENGYAVFEDIMNHEFCDKYLARIKKHANEEFAAIMNPDRFEYLVAQTLSNLKEDISLEEKVSMVEECRKTAEMTFEIMAHKEAVQILEDLQQTEVVGLMSQMLYKEANTRYAKQSWHPHQDNIYPRNNNTLKNGFGTQYLTTNFFLEDANQDNGSLYIYPGSHKFGLFEAEPNISYREKGNKNPGNKISNKVLERFNKIDCEFKKGDLLVLNGNCVHGSYPNNSNKSRPLLSVSYISKGEDFIAGKNAKRKVIELH